MPTPTPKTYATSAFTLAALALPVSLAVLGACGGHFSHRKKETANGTIVVPPGTKRVRFVGPAGRISVEAGKRPGVIAYSAELKLAADDEPGLASLAKLRLEPHAEPSDEPGLLLVVSERLPPKAREERLWVEAQVVAEIPPELSIELDCLDGSASATDMRGKVRVRLSHGPVLLKRCHGDAHVRTGEGDLTIDAHEGALDAESGAGKIVAFVARLGVGGVRLVSGNGGIQAHLPDDSSFELDMRAPEGKLVSSWKLPIHRELGGVFMNGKAGSGGPLVFIESLHGSVSLRGERTAK